MATRAELMAEAYRRGILPPEQKAMYEEAIKRGLVEAPKAPMVGGEFNPSNEMNEVQKLQVGVGRGLKDVWQGGKQTVLHAADFLTPGHFSRVAAGEVTPAKQYDLEIAKENALYESGLGDSGSAQFGRFVGQNAPSLAMGMPIGAGARALAARNVASPTALAAIEGGVSSIPMTITQPVLDGGDYGQQKLQQAATNMALATGFGAGAAKLGQVIEGAANLPSNIARAVAGEIQSPGQSVVSRTVSGSVSPARARVGQNLAERTGVDLTPADISGSRAGKMVENLARQSVFTADEALAGDIGRARQLINFAKKTARAISTNKFADPATVGTRVQQVVDNAARRIADQRSAWGRRAYGAIDRAAQGQKIVSTSNLRNEMAAILKENEGVVGADSGKIVSQIRGWLSGQDKTLQFGDAGKISASSALRQLQAFAKGARGEANIFSDLQARGADRALAGRLQRALMADLDDAAANNGRGNLGEMVRRANDGWRRYSQELDALENSALGSVVGDDFASEIAGVAFNKVQPEKVFQRLVNSQPSEIAVVKKYLERFSPETWADFQQARLISALQAARMAPASAGSMRMPIDPVRLVNELTGGAGARGKLGMDRLKAIYGDSPVWPQIQDLIEVSRRMGDSFGKNYSNTAVAAQAMSAMDKLSQFAGGALRQGIGSAATIMGLKQYTQQAMNRVPVQPYALPASAGVARQVGSVLLPGVVQASSEEK